jgi:hypothetical protein
MPLITDTINKVFDKASVHKGDLIRAKHVTWDEPRNGIVTAVSDNKLTVLFLPGLGNVTNYFTILASEVETGKWTVRWTTDMEIINTEGTAGDEQ